MSVVAIIEEKGGRLSETIRSALRKDAKGNVTLAGEPALKSGVSPQLIVLSRKAPNMMSYSPHCRVLLTPGCPATLGIRADCLVSYGMSERSSITLSSIEADSLILTLQRELMTIDGEILDRQDIALRPLHGISPGDMLAASGALLLLGLNPGNLY